MKLCSKCGELKPLSEFHRAANTKDGRRKDCKACKCGAAKARYANNTDVYRARAASYRHSNPDKARKATAKWRDEHREATRKYTRAYRAANPDSKRRSESRRRARKLETKSIPYTQAELVAHWDFLGVYGCFYCSGPIEHADHYVPLSRGGEDSIYNIVPSCRKHNLQKSAKDPTIFGLSLCLPNPK